MATEYFIACDEFGLHLFDTKPHLERQVTRPIHWEWRDSEGKNGLTIVGNGLSLHRAIELNTYIKLIDFGIDTLFGL